MYIQFENGAFSLEACGGERERKREGPHMSSYLFHELDAGGLSPGLIFNSCGCSDILETRTKDKDRNRC